MSEYIAGDHTTRLDSYIKQIRVIININLQSLYVNGLNIKQVNISSAHLSYSQIT